MLDKQSPEPQNQDAPLENLSNAPQMEKKKTKKYVKYSPLSLILLGICAFVFSFSMLGLLEQAVLDTAGEKELGSILGSAFGDGGNTDPSNKGEDLAPSTGTVGQWQQISPYDVDPNTLSFLQTPDFGALKSENPDTVAWIYWPTTAEVKGLPFNLPVVQGINNDYYLTRSFDRSNSENGWVYADYRCDMEDLKSNRNTIFYGHARSYLIFGGLKYLNTKSKWQQDGYNHYIYVNTPTERSVWQVFSWYETTVDFNYISTYFSDDDAWITFLNTIQDKNTISAFERFEFNANDRIITLSTCKGNDENVRVAVHAVLVKYEATGQVGNLPEGESPEEIPEEDPFVDESVGEENVTGGDAPPDLSNPNRDTSSDPVGGVSSETETQTESSQQTSTNTGTPTDTGTSSGGGTSTSTGSTTQSDTQASTEAGNSGTNGTVAQTQDSGTPADTES